MLLWGKHVIFYQHLQLFVRNWFANSWKLKHSILREIDILRIQHLLLLLLIHFFLNLVLHRLFISLILHHLHHLKLLFIVLLHFHVWLLFLHLLFIVIILDFINLFLDHLTIFINIHLIYPSLLSVLVFNYYFT